MANAFSTARVEAFSDGVTAVIITVMVLELKVPAFGGAAGLRAIAPTLAVYALSYTFVGIYWINHHLLLHRIDQGTPRILRANLVWLFFLSLLPFFTAYVLDKREDSYSVALYSGGLLATALAFMMLRLAVGACLRRQGRLEHADRAMQAKHWVSIVVYALAIPFGFVAPVLTLYIIAAVTLLWIVPTFAAEHVHRHPADPELPG